MKTALKFGLLVLTLLFTQPLLFGQCRLLFVINGSEGDQYGKHIGAAGDVNNDGYDDIIVGIPSQEKAYVYCGLTGDLLRAWNNPLPVTDEFGESVAGVGDLNDDGYDDVIVGSPGYDPDYPYTTRGATIFSGYNSGEIMNFDGDQYPYAFYGMGEIIAVVPDSDGDGKRDVVFGLAGMGRAPMFSTADTDSIICMWDCIGWPGGGDEFGRAIDAIDLEVPGGRIWFMIGNPGQNCEEGDPPDCGGFRVYTKNTDSPSCIEEEIIYGGNPDAYPYGSSIAFISDLDSDGLEDFLVGCPGCDIDYLTNRGSVAIWQIVYGGANSMGKIWVGANEGDQFGHAVANVGDVDGDGIDDHAIGAPYNDDTYSDAGAVYVYNGGNLNQTKYGIMWSARGTEYGEAFGYEIVGLGDVNGDGFSDFAVGAPYNDDGGTSAGRIYVFGGGNASFFGNFIGETADEQFGKSMAKVGDYNDDGVEDVVVGAPYYESSFGQSLGRYYVFSLTDHELISEHIGYGYNNQFGYAVCGPGDLSGDGIADIVVTDPKHEHSVTGEEVGAVYFDSYFASRFWTIEGEASGDLFGFSVASAGDVDLRGRNDVIVGAPVNDAGANMAGRAYVYSVETHGLLHVFTGVVEGGRLGWSVSEAGQFDRDPYPDVVVGAINPTGIGFIKVYSGLTGGEIFHFDGQETGDHFGMAVIGGEDLTGDGYDDIVVGAPYDNTGGEDAGRVYLISGESHEIARIWTGQPGEQLGYTLSLLRYDAIKSSKADFIAGARNYDSAGVRIGRVYAFSGISNEPLYAISGNQSYEKFSQAVCDIGDINEDGITDILVGAPSNDVWMEDAGRAYIYLGEAKSGGSCGDANNSGGIDIDDVVYLIEYVFQGGPEPIPLESGNADCEGVIDIDDIVYLINYLFLGGYAPCDPDGDGAPDC